jgi:lysophospholipase-3
MKIDLILVVLLESFLKKRVVKDIEPIILVPGIAGSALEVKVSEAVEPHYICYSHWDWRRLWLNIAALLPFERDCWYHNIDIFYDNKTGKFYPNKGIETRVIDFGGVSGIDYLDYELGIGISLTSYFSFMIDELKAVGYQVGKTIRGAPFDWRKTIDPDNFKANFVKLIEDTYTQNQNKKVHIIAHSLGAIHTTDVFNDQTQEWKDKYIASFISIAAPWSGAPKALRAIISGDNFGIELTSWLPLIQKLSVRPMLRRSGTVLLVPEDSFYNTTELVRTPTRSYSARDYKQLFKDLNSPITSTILESVDGFIDGLQAPGVDLHCLYGTTFPTEAHYTYNKGWDSDPIIKYDEGGDGTVPEFSLQRCITFKKQQKQIVEVKDFDLGDHVEILFNAEVMKYILNVVVQSTSKN